MSLTMSANYWETWYMMSYIPILICCLMKDVDITTCCGGVSSRALLGSLGGATKVDIPKACGGSWG